MTPRLIRQLRFLMSTRLRCEIDLQVHRRYTKEELRPLLTTLHPLVPIRSFMEHPSPRPDCVCVYPNGARGNPVITGSTGDLLVGNVESFPGRTLNPASSLVALHSKPSYEIGQLSTRIS